MTQISLPNGFTPRSPQADLMRYMDAGGKRAAVCWPRRFGKDLTALHQTVKEMHQRPGMYFHLLPNHKQARKVLWDAYDNDGRRIIDVAIPPPLRESVNETEMKIKLKCGGLWQLVGSDYYDSLVGANPFGLVFSEAAQNDPRAWSFFRPMLAGNGGWAIHISTPRGYNDFHKLIELAKRDSSWFHSHLTSYQTGHISAEVLAQEQREMPDELFRQEYLCDFSAANVGAIFGRYVEALEKRGGVCAVRSMGDASEVFVTSDIGYRDKAAFIWWRRMRGGWEIFHYDEGTGMDAADWIERLRPQPQAGTLILPHDARAKTFVSKQSVVETFLKERPWDGCEVRVNEQRKKTDSVNAGRMMLKGNLRISDNESCAPLLLALRDYSYKYDDKTKTFSSEPDHNWSSHAADAFMEGAARLEIPAPPPEPSKLIIPPMDRSFSLDQLHETVGWTAQEQRL
jgi:phage terminase large subunit